MATFNIKLLTAVIILLCSPQFVSAAPNNHFHGDREHTHNFSEHGKYHKHGSSPAATYRSKRINKPNPNILILSNPFPADKPKHKKFGYYDKDEIKVLWLNSRGRVKLLESLTFTDPDGKKWLAPKGSIVNGASIPLPFQEALGGPYDGKYVMASVIHDVAVAQRKRSWKEVHKVFYYAMLASGVDRDKADLMYSAVYQAGPRWGNGADKRLSDQELLKFLSKKKSSSKVTDEISVIDSNMKEYSGAALYNRAVTTDGNSEHSTGVIVRGNDFYIGAEINEQGLIVPVFGWEPSVKQK